MLFLDKFADHEIINATSLAMMELRITLVHLLWHLDIRSVDGAPQWGSHRRNETPDFVHGVEQTPANV